jgi:hypothetical protein
MPLTKRQLELKGQWRSVPQNMDEPAFLRDWQAIHSWQRPCGRSLRNRRITIAGCPGLAGDARPRIRLVPLRGRRSFSGSCSFCLGNHQDESAAVSAALAAQIARVPTRSLDQYVCDSSSRDLGGRDCDLQQRAARDFRAYFDPVDDHHRRRNKRTAVHAERIASLHFSERNRGDRKRRNVRSWPGTPAEWIDGVAALKD